MSKFKAFLKRKDIEFSAKRYGIDALGAMAQGLFASLLVGTILSTIGTQFSIEALVTIGDFASAVKGCAMAIAIGFALKAPPLVLFSLATVGYAADKLGGAGGPLAVLLITIVAAEFGKAVSKETKLDILVTPVVTIGLGCVLSMLCAPYIGKAASAVGHAIMWATELRPFLMGIIISAIVGIALTLPISSAAICAALGLTGLAGGAALAGCCAQMIGFAVMSFRENKWGGLVGQIGVYTGWVNAIADGTKASITAFDWIGLVLISFVLPAVLSWVFCLILRKIGWIKENDLKLDL